MVIPDTDTVLDKLVHLENSTTLFLESIKGQSLKVAIESQLEVDDPEQTILRTVKLFFTSVDLPLLFCTSHINKANLSTEEYCNLTSGEMPIGRIFHPYRTGNIVAKKNTIISKELNLRISSFLNVRSPVVFKKKYDYWAGDRYIGPIAEYFNEESLARL